MFKKIIIPAFASMAIIFATQAPASAAMSVAKPAATQSTEAPAIIVVRGGRGGFRGGFRGHRFRHGGFRRHGWHRGHRWHGRHRWHRRHGWHRHHRWHRRHWRYGRRYYYRRSYY